MKKLIQLLLILGLGVLHAQAQSQQGKINGQLTDSTTKEAMPAATVVLLNAKDSTVATTAMTDNKGNFELTNIADGSYRLYVSFLGYKTINKPLQISQDHQVLALGNLPARFFSGSNETIHGLRGRWMEVEAGNVRLPVMTTFHPQDLMAAPPCKRLAWQDLLDFRAKLIG